MSRISCLEGAEGDGREEGVGCRQVDAGTGRSFSASGDLEQESQGVSGSRGDPGSGQGRMPGLLLA